MPQRKPLLVKSGAEYWKFLEQTARQVEKWPEWKTGERSTLRRAKTLYNEFLAEYPGGKT